jgi:hypothetical protein
MSNLVQQNIFRTINVIDTLEVLTKLNLHFSHKPTDEYFNIQNAVLSYIISSGNILNRITEIPIELDVYIDELNKYIKLYLNDYKEL